MTPRSLPSFRPHEWIFGGFLLLTTGRLLLAGGAAGLSIAFAGMFLSIFVGAMIQQRWPSPWTARLRLALFPCLVNLVYWQLGPVVGHLRSRAWDPALLVADRKLMTETPSVLLEAWCTPVLTEILSACYMLFFPAVLAAFVAGIVLSEPQGARLFDGLISIYAFGFLGYSLIPAAGPHLAMPEAFSSSQTGGILTTTNAALVAEGSNRVDVFPSLHTAITVFLMAWLRTRHRRIFMILLLPAAGLCLATLYLRYHYAVDVVAGIALAAFGLSLTRIAPPAHEPDPSF